MHCGKDAFDGGSADDEHWVCGCWWNRQKEKTKLVSERSEKKWCCTSAVAAIAAFSTTTTSEWLLMKLPGTLCGSFKFFLLLVHYVSCFYADKLIHLGKSKWWCWVLSVCLCLCGFECFSLGMCVAQFENANKQQQQPLNECLQPVMAVWFFEDAISLQHQCFF